MRRRKKRPEPFFRRFDGWWYVQIGKRQIKLAQGQDNEDAAWRAYYRVMAKEGPAVPAAPFRDPTVTTVCNLFLDFSQKTNAPPTYEWYRDFLEDFCGFAGKLRLSELDSTHVAAWLDRHPAWKGSRRGAITAVKRAFNYAYNEGKIDTNPMRRVKKPPPRARERDLTPKERQTIFENYPEGDCFRDYLFALENTGCRPGEVAAVTAEDVDLHNELWILHKHKTEHSTGRPRVVILTPEMLVLTKRLLAKQPDGPLFRNEDDRPWNRNSIRGRFRRVRKKLKLGNDLVAYLYRHAVCTDLLEAGAGIAQTAELLGHKGTETIMRHYNKLRERRQHLRAQITKATRKNRASGETPPHLPGDAA